jgi:hypothetical protein
MSSSPSRSLWPRYKSNRGFVKARLAGVEVIAFNISLRIFLYISRYLIHSSHGLIAARESSPSVLAYSRGMFYFFTYSSRRCSMAVTYSYTALRAISNLFATLFVSGAINSIALGSSFPNTYILYAHRRSDKRPILNHLLVSLEGKNH